MSEPTITKAVIWSENPRIWVAQMSCGHHVHRLMTDSDPTGGTEMCMECASPQEPSEPAKHCAWTFCPKCGAKESNDGARGGTENCWHCVCGFVACVYDYTTEDLRVENTRLRAALEPFAAMADAYDPPEDDDHEIVWDRKPTLGQLRVARAALTPDGSTDR